MCSLNAFCDDYNVFVFFLVSQHWLIPGNPYSLDVRFNEDKTRILASRFLIQAVNISDTNHEKQMVKDLRQICRNAPVQVSVFHPYFVFFDQFELVRPTSIQSMCYGAVIMMGISYIFIPNFLCSLWVAFSIVSIELGVAGYMSLWDVNLDSISMINLIMCIGFSVDFTAHICYAYMSSSARRPDDRVREALYSLGMPIMQGAMSTILGCIGLLLADSYIFLVFFKMIFLVIFFGAMHGMFLLPVLLSLFGPGSCTPLSQFDEEDSKPQLAIIGRSDKSYAPHPYYNQYAPQLAISSGDIGGGVVVPAAGQFGGKTLLGAQYKSFAGLVEDKDQGIGTSGEDSSESSSSKSQRRKALEDENIRGRYEEGWRRSSAHNLQIGSSQFQPAIDLYGTEAKHMWTGRKYNVDSIYPMPQQRASRSNDHETGTDEIDRRKFDNRKRSADHNYDQYFNGAEHYNGNQYYATKMDEDDDRNRFPVENKRKLSDERRPRGKYSPHEGLYRPNPNRSSSQHNLYYPKQPQRSSSYHAIHQLRHMGDMGFP